MTHQPQQLGNDSALAFILGGNSTVTLKSLKTGTSFTYRVQKYFRPFLYGYVYRVKVKCLQSLSRPHSLNNDSDYVFIGTIFPGDVPPPRFHHSSKSCISADAPSVKAFAWAFAHLAIGDHHSQLEVWHEGRCGRCNRKLTVPESIASGYGPECATMN
jgi:hypothetical protein